VRRIEQRRIEHRRTWWGGLAGRTGREDWSGGLAGRTGREDWWGGLVGRTGGEDWSGGLVGRTGGEDWSGGLVGRLLGICFLRGALQRAVEGIGDGEKGGCFEGRRLGEDGSLN
jgi:hypothetical protein